MTNREYKILKYYGPTRLQRTYAHEKDFIKVAKEFINMLPKCKLLRESDAPVAGVADLVVCYRGRFIACELKAEDGEPSLQQLKFIDDVREAEGSAGVCRTLSEIWTLLCNSVQEPENKI